MTDEKINVRVSKKIHAKAKKHVKITKQSLGGFYDLAVIRQIELDKLNWGTPDLNRHKATLNNQQ